jgi:hypothetical protein
VGRGRGIGCPLMSTIPFKGSREGISWVSPSGKTIKYSFKNIDRPILALSGQMGKIKAAPTHIHPYSKKGFFSFTIDNFFSRI